MGSVNIAEIIGPETDLEQRIISDPKFIEGALWGKPRGGHPEGQVIYHIQDVLQNVGRSDPFIREKLRLITILHDTFKYKVDKTKPKTGENHHGMIARRFAEQYITDTDILEVIELHDEAYNSWQKGHRDNKWDVAEKRANTLLQRLGNTLPLYIAFYSCDNTTGDKSNESFEWFLNRARKFSDVPLEEKLLSTPITSETPGVVQVVYTNWEGKTAIRTILPKRLYLGETEYHKGKQYLLECFDVEKQATRTYAMKGIVKWF